MYNVHQPETYKANSIDSDEISHSVVPRQGLQCLIWESSIYEQAATEDMSLPIKRHLQFAADGNVIFCCFFQKYQIRHDISDTKPFSFRKLGKMTQNVSSAAVLIGALRIKFHFHEFQPTTFPQCPTEMLDVNLR